MWTGINKEQQFILRMRIGVSLWPCKTRLVLFRQNKNTLFASWVFEQRKQHEGESIEQFTTELRSLVTDCEYGNLSDTLLRNRIVFGAKNKSVRDKLLNNTPDLKEVITEFRRRQEAEKQISKLN